MTDELLSRIAQALERQVEQYDESVARNVAVRSENVAMRERDIERFRQQHEDGLRETAESICVLREAISYIDEFKVALGVLRDRVSVLENRIP